MIGRDTLRYGLYIAAGVFILALSGIFNSFETREVIEDGVTLGTVFLVIILVGAGAFVASRTHMLDDAVRLALNGAIAGLVVGAGLALLLVLQANLDLTFVFQNLKPLLGGTVAFGQQEVGAAVVYLLLASAALGLLGGVLLLIPERLRRVLVVSLSMTVVIGLLEAQVENILSLPDALALALVFALGYVAGFALKLRTIPIRLGAGLAAGAAAGVVLALLASGGGLAAGGILRGAGLLPVILSLSALSLIVVLALSGMVGALASGASRTMHNGAVYFAVTIVILGVLNWQGPMTVTAASITFALLALAAWFVSPLGERTAAQFEALPRQQQRNVGRLAALAALAILIIVPLFVGQYITDVLNLVGLYIIMGIGLNVVVGYAGLLDLGYVAFFAIGAYSTGLLTTPSLLTCGGIHPSEITPENIQTVCSGVMTFWEAWPVAIALSAFSGVLLGIPVLRLRGDYLAIVTLGFGEIIRIVIKFDDFKPLFGAAQGIANIPRPVIDLTALNPAWRIELTGSSGIYYLVLVGIVLTAYVATRLATTRLGRAWRAMRADEDVAQAMGVHLVQTKLLAFAIGAAFAGMGGAVAGTRLYGAYPDSYTLLVSINVLCLIIIGGLGSIPGVVVGSFVLIGLPEVLRELEDYRLLAFGMLLVLMMLLKPRGLIPPPVRRLSEIVAEHRSAQGARS